MTSSEKMKDIHGFQKKWIKPLGLVLAIGYCSVYKLRFPGSEFGDEQYWVGLVGSGRNSVWHDWPELRKSDFDRNWPVTWVDGYPNIPKSTLYNPEFDVDSKSAIKTMLGARNI